MAQASRSVRPKLDTRLAGWAVSSFMEDSAALSADVLANLFLRAGAPKITAVASCVLGQETVQIGYADQLADEGVYLDSEDRSWIETAFVRMGLASNMGFIDNNSYDIATDGHAMAIHIEDAAITPHAHNESPFNPRAPFAMQLWHMHILNPDYSYFETNADRLVGCLKAAKNNSRRPRF